MLIGWEIFEGERIPSGWRRNTRYADPCSPQRATGDGFIGHPITPSVMKKLPYDVVKDFSAIGLIGNGAYVLLVNPSVPAKTVDELSRSRDR